MTKFVYLVLVCCKLLFAVDAVQNCIEDGGQKKCSKLTSSTDCNTQVTGLSCMDFYRGKSGNIKSYCAGPQQQGCWCDPSLISTEACAQGMSCQQTSCSKNGCQYACLPSGNIGLPVCPAAQPQWSLVYWNDATGNPQNGTNIMDLYNAVLAGAEVKVWSPILGLTTLQKISVHSDNAGNYYVFGQLLFYISHLTNVTAPPRSMYCVFSTSGNLQLTAFYVGKATNVLYLNTNIGMVIKWYIRQTSTVVGNTATLSRAVQDGGSVRVGLQDSIRHLDSVGVIQKTSVVYGISMWGMADILFGKEFNVTEQWEYTSCNSGGDVIQSSWLMNVHTNTDYVTSTNQAINWFVNPCWEPVYRHSGDGSVLFGSLFALQDSIANGKRIKVQVGGQFYQSNVITVDSSGVVTAQIYDSMDSDLTDAKLKFLEVSTSGNVTTVTTKVGDGETVTASTVASEVSWFAEAGTWNNAAIINETGVAVSGSKQNISDAFFAGADIRYCLLFNEMTMWLEAELIVVVAPDLRMSHSRQLLSNNNGYFRRFSFTFTSGVYDTADYRWETDELQTKQVYPRLKTMWFTNL